MIFLGIDPGISGGISAIDEHGNVLLAEPTPCVKIVKKGKSKPDYDIKKMAEMVSAFSPDEALVCQELTHAMPGNGGVSMYNFGRGHGIWEGLVCALGFEQKFCTPQKWKKMYPDIVANKLTKESRASMSSKEIASWKRNAKAEAKKKSIEKAKSLFPSSSNNIKKIKHDGIAESLLIANWARSNYGK